MMHKYSTVALLSFLFILGAGFAFSASLESYGELYTHSDTPTANAQVYAANINLVKIYD